MSMDLGIDLGTSSVKIYMPKHGIVLNEPAMVIVNKIDGQIVAIGNEANDMSGRTPEGVQAVRPIRNGVITNFNLTVSMLKHFIKKTVKNKFSKIRAVICIPSGITEVEKRAVEEAVKTAGAKDVRMLEEPLAAAIGAGLPIREPLGSMVVDIGAGTTEVAVISLGGIVISNSIRVAGDAFDLAIVQYVKKKYNLMIGEVTAEKIKIGIGSENGSGLGEVWEMKGRDLVQGMPKNATIKTDEIRDALSEAVMEIVDVVKLTLEQTPPELASDIMETGIVLTGGGAMLKGLGRIINMETAIPVFIAESPMECVAIGAGKTLENFSIMKNAINILG
ncbi:MAG: rod shape-determining protein [Oscillospiraceae bacterium]